MIEESSILKTEAVHASEMSINMYHVCNCYIPENSNLHYSCVLFTKCEKWRHNWGVVLDRVFECFIFENTEQISKWCGVGSWNLIPQMGGYLSLSFWVKVISGTHIFPYSVSNGMCFLGVKRPELQADYSAVTVSSTLRCMIDKRWRHANVTEREVSFCLKHKQYYLSHCTNVRKMSVSSLESELLGFWTLFIIRNWICFRP
jgi:hypothetical protein